MFGFFWHARVFTNPTQVGVAGAHRPQREDAPSTRLPRPAAIPDLDEKVASSLRYVKESDFGVGGGMMVHHREYSISRYVSYGIPVMRHVMDDRGNGSDSGSGLRLSTPPPLPLPAVS